jgi:hypothetical protein
MPEARIELTTFALRMRCTTLPQKTRRLVGTPILPVTGQLSNHFVEGMRKIYELEPFIKTGSIPIEPLNKGLKGYKRAS